MSLLIASLFAAQAATAAPAAPDYAKPTSWLCLQGRADVCSAPLATTALTPAGYAGAVPASRAKDSGVDCFVVYPTVSRDSGLNSDLVPGESEEKASMAVQFARFGNVCSVYAPMYRSMTVGAVTVAATGGDVTRPAQIAYGDVRDAWRNFLASRNKGRPYVLIGHSQGALMLQLLIANEIEGHPEAKRMKLAIIPGFNVFVPAGKRVGGTFKSTPLCATASETGCVLTWASYREKNAPPAGAMFGFADKPGMTVACTNPASPGSTGWVDFDSYWYARSTQPVPGGPITWSSQGAPPTPYVRTEGLASGRCVNDGPRGYLSIRTNADPSDKRTDRIGGEVGMAGFFIPGWGMHLADMNVAQGDLVRRVAALNDQATRGTVRAR